MRPWSITARLLAAVLVAAGIPFAVFTAYTVKLVRSLTSEARVERFLRTAAIDVAERINAFVRERRRDLLTWAADPRAVELLGRREAARRSELASEWDVAIAAYAEFDVAFADVCAAWRAACQSRPSFAELLFVDSSGGVISADGRTGDNLTLSPEESRAVARAHAGSVVGIDLYDDGRRGRASIAFVAPVRDGAGRALGVVLGRADWSVVALDIVARVSVGLSDERGDAPNGSIGYAFLWDAGAARVLAHPDPSLVRQPLDRVDGGGLADLLGTVRRLDSTSVVKYRYRGDEKRSGFCRTHAPSLTVDGGEGDGFSAKGPTGIVELAGEDSGFGWIVGVTVHDEAIFAPLRGVVGLIVAALLTGGLGLVGCIVLASRAITRPLRELATEASRIARGEFSARVKPSGPRETASLARSFNQMAEDLDKSQAALIQAEKDAAWREMALQVSHDIRNPLTPMKLWVQLLERAWNERSPEFESILKRAVTTLEAQIEQLRRIASDFRAPAAVRPPDLREPVLLSSVLSEARELFAAAARSRGVALELRGGDAVVKGDRGALLRVFGNLLDNAIHAAPPRSAVGLDVLHRGNRVLVAVEDEGPGIEPEARKRLFTPYFSTKSQGTGLGLVNVRWMVEAHGGRVWLDENRARGTRMVVELPAQAGQEASHP